ncbi:ornithine aminotransferase [Gonapodya sp. JEL0774]|nr:ornithine aminotransferase [Gonapodya sp. JEL0774]
MASIIPLNGSSNGTIDSKGPHRSTPPTPLLKRKGDIPQSGSAIANVIHLEHEYSAHNYHPLPVVFSKAKGVHVWDPEGKRYMDFLSAYSAVNQGHCHPKILETLINQAQTLTLSSRAFYNDQFGKYAEFVTKYFGFDMILPMNTGAEAVETALKLARKWGYIHKKIPENKALILAATENFHGRTIGIITMSSDPDAKNEFGPYLPNVGPVCPVTHKTIRHNHPEDLEAALEAHGPLVAAFLVEPIQGEAGINVPDDGYLKKCYDMCKKHNVLFIADEIQTGLGRTGKLLACDWDEVKPDVLILGKALSGGVYPVSAVLASKEVMLCIKPGEHGSTYGGNPLGSAVSITALQVLKDENMTENVRSVTAILFMDRVLMLMLRTSSVYWELIRYALRVRGKGLLNAIVIDDEDGKSLKSAWHVCLLMAHHGLLAKPTHRNIIRLAPPLVITEEQILESVDIIRRSLKEIEHMSAADLAAIPGAWAEIGKLKVNGLELTSKGCQISTGERGMKFEFGRVSLDIETSRKKSGPPPKVYKMLLVQVAVGRARLLPPNFAEDALPPPPPGYDSWILRNERAKGEEKSLCFEYIITKASQVLPVCLVEVEYDIEVEKKSREPDKVLSQRRAKIANHLDALQDRGRAVTNMADSLRLQIETIYKQACQDLDDVVLSKLATLHGDELELRRQLHEMDQLDEFVAYQKKQPTQFLLSYSQLQQKRSELHDFRHFRDVIDVKCDVKVSGTISLAVDPACPRDATLLSPPRSKTPSVFKSPAPTPTKKLTAKSSGFMSRSESMVSQGRRVHQIFSDVLSVGDASSLTASGDDDDDDNYDF